MPTRTPSMTSYQAGDLVLVAFPFTSGQGAKVRPAMVVADTGDADVLVARLTTKAPQSASDVPIAAWSAAGLLGPANARVHKLATIEKSLVHKQLGHLDPTDRPQIAAMLKQVFVSW